MDEAKGEMETEVQQLEKEIYQLEDAANTSKILRYSNSISCLFHCGLNHFIYILKLLFLIPTELSCEVQHIFFMVMEGSMFLTTAECKCLIMH